MEALPVVLETGRLVHVLGSFSIGRITAIENEPDSPVGIAVECIDGVHWFTEHDITSSRAPAETTDKGCKREPHIRWIEQDHGPERKVLP